MEPFHQTFVFLSLRGKDKSIRSESPNDVDGFVEASVFLYQRMNGFICLLKGVVCIVSPSYTEGEILQIMENLPISNK